jgi:hypothetical protein
VQRIRPPEPAAGSSDHNRFTLQNSHDHILHARGIKLWPDTNTPFVTNADDFKAKIIGALRRLQKMPHLVRAFFTDPNLRYIAT